MGIFDFFKKKNKESKQESTRIMGMVLLADTHPIDHEGFKQELSNKWRLTLNDTAATDKTSIYEINGYQVALMHIPAPIPGTEVEDNAAYNYYWAGAAEEVAKHSSHIVVIILNGGKDAVEENRLFSQVMASILTQSNSICVYIGSRSLVLKKDFYLENLDEMTETSLPLYIWLYFGMRQENNKQSIYTYGLKEFGKTEMEIVNSDKPIAELNEMMYNLAHYVIAYNVTLKSGETVGISAEQKLKITRSQGKFVDEPTLKIDF